MKCIVLILVTLSITACATTNYFNHNMNRWIGVNEQKVLSELGMPDQSYQGDGFKVLKYMYRGNTTVMGAQGVAGMYHLTKNQEWCDVTLTVRSGVVERWMADGNDCYAPNPKY